MMDNMNNYFLRDDLPDGLPDGLPEFFSESLSDIADANLHAPRKRHWYETCCEILDDDSALHAWPVPAKRARQQVDAWEHGNSLDCHAFLQKNATPSALVSPPSCPARPRANAMHVLDEDGVAAGDVVPPLRDSRSHPDNISLFARFAQLASRNGITPLHLPSPDKFPTTVQMEAIVRAIMVT